MTPTDPAMLAALAALGQHVTGLGTAVTLLAHQQAAQEQARQQQQQQAGRDGQAERRPGSSSAGGEAGLLGRSLTMAAARVMAFLAPIVAVSNVLSQTISGLGVFTAAIKVLGATIAPLVLPVFVLLAAAIVAVSDELWEGVKNVLPVWYGFILNQGVPAFVALVSAVRTVITWLDRLAIALNLKNEPADPLAGRRDSDPIVGNAVNPPVEGMSPDRIRAEWEEMRRNHQLQERQLQQAKTPAEVNAALNGLRESRNQQDYYLKRFEGDETENRRALDEGRVPRLRPNGGLGPSVPSAPPPPGQQPAQPGQSSPPPAIGQRPPTPGERFNVALRDVVASLRQSMGPPSQMLATASVNAQAQKDALQADPLQRRVLERGFQAIEEFMRLMPAVERNTRERPDGLFGPPQG